MARRGSPSRRHPLRRTSDPGGGEPDFPTTRKILAWGGAAAAFILSANLWLIKDIAGGMDKDRANDARQQLVDTKQQIVDKVSTQWSMFYTKAEMDSRRAELDRRYEETKTALLQIQQSIMELKLHDAQDQKGKR